MASKILFNIQVIELYAYNRDCCKSHMKFDKCFFVVVTISIITISIECDTGGAHIRQIHFERSCVNRELITTNCDRELNNVFEAVEGIKKGIRVCWEYERKMAVDKN